MRLELKVLLVIKKNIRLLNNRRTDICDSDSLELSRFPRQSVVGPKLMNDKINYVLENNHAIPQPGF